MDRSRIQEIWEAAAPGWAKWEGVLSEAIKEATEKMLDAAKVSPGARVLDLASGAGAQTRQAAVRVGSTGRILASDISATMLEHLRSNADAAKLTNIDTLQGTADEVSPQAAPYDAAICRLGLMLFPGPETAVAAVHQGLKPGGCFAAMVIGDPAENPFFSRSMGILLRHAGKEPPAPGQPSLFALANPERLKQLFEDSGLRGVRVERVQASVPLPDAASAVEMMQQAFGAYRAVVAELSDSDRTAAWREVEDYLSGFETEDGFSTDVILLIASGTRL